MNKVVIFMQAVISIYVLFFTNSII